MMNNQEVSADTEALVRVGLSRAEQGLGGFLAAPLAIDVDMITIKPVLELGTWSGAPEQEVVGIYVSFSGDVAGHCLLCLDEASTRQLGTRLLGEEPGPWTVGGGSMIESALLEAGNIAVSGLVNGLADNRGWAIQVSPPVLARDMLGALVNSVLAACSWGTDALLAVKARFYSDGESIAGTLLLIPDAASLPRMTGAARH